ncbi:unnamed protein product [Parnassius apollo]|uniref:(apollo) hypothetical protein n=1 Tax=Parnassius apollo TaxID=110799 RepID=A0A8S3VZT0_PARAO|nr:unnamed protein product [Parnassius apollo]
MRATHQPRGCDQSRAAAASSGSRSAASALPECPLLCTVRKQSGMRATHQPRGCDQSRAAAAGSGSRSAAKRAARVSAAVHSTKVKWNAGYPPATRL